MSLVELNHSSVNQQLRSMTEAFLNSHPTLTLNALAQRSGVAATTMRRLMQEGNNGEIAPHIVLSLVSYLLREKKISKLIKIVEGPVGDLLRKCFDQYIFDENQSSHTIEVDLNEVFKDKLNYLIYKVAANLKGTTTDEIKNSFGLLGLKKLDELIARDLIIIDECGILHAKIKNFSVDLVRAHELSHTLLDQYKPCDVELGFNLFYSLSEGLNEAGIKEVKKITLDSVKKVFEVMNNNEYVGNIPYFSLFVADVIGDSPSKNFNREVLQ